MNKDYLFLNKKIARVGLAISLTIILKQLVFDAPLFGRIEFSQLPVVISGILFGSWVGFITGLLGDIVGSFIRAGARFSWVFPLAFAFKGVIGAFFAKFFFARQKNKIKLILATILLYFLIIFVVEYVTYVIYFVYELKVYSFKFATIRFFSSRFLKTILLLPVWVLVILPFINNRKNWS